MANGEFTPEELAAMDTRDVVALVRRNSGDQDFYWRVREAVLNRAADEIEVSDTLLKRCAEWFAAYMHDRESHDEAAVLLAAIRNRDPL